MIKLKALPLLLREISGHILNIRSPWEAAISSSSSCCCVLCSRRYHGEESHQHLRAHLPRGVHFSLSGSCHTHKPGCQSWLWNAERASLSECPLSQERFRSLGFRGVWTKHGPAINLSLLQILLFRYCLAGNVAAVDTTLLSWGHLLQDSYLPWGEAVHSTPSCSLQGGPPTTEWLRVEQPCPYHPEWSPGLLGANKMF